MNQEETKKDDVNQIQKVLKSINAAWINGNPDDLTHFFDDQIIILSPDMKILGKGKEACIQSYKDFLNRAAIISFADQRPDAFCFGTTAAASYLLRRIALSGEQECPYSGTISGTLVPDCGIYGIVRVLGQVRKPVRSGSASWCDGSGFSSGWTLESDL